MVKPVYPPTTLVRGGGGIIKGTEVISVKIVYIVHIMDYVSQVSIVAHGLLFIEVADNNLL
jgi:hypothetical protein